MSLPRIIGLTGYARHGKDTVAEVFVEAGYERHALADQMKVALRTLDPIVNVHGNHLSDFANDGEQFVKDNLPEYRRLLQVLGTEVGRQMIGEDTWIEALVRSIPGFYSDQGPKVVIPDVRFVNEARFIRRARGEVYAVVRVGLEEIDGCQVLSPFDNGVGVTHQSEREIGAIQTPVVFVNSGIEEVQKDVRRFIETQTAMGDDE